LQREMSLERGQGPYPGEESHLLQETAEYGVLQMSVDVHQSGKDRAHTEVGGGFASGRLPDPDDPLVLYMDLAIFDRGHVDRKQQWGGQTGRPVGVAKGIR